MLTFVQTSKAQISGPISSDFVMWLTKNPSYGIKYAHEFLRTDLGEYGSFGGKSMPEEQVIRVPVVFIHGNSDQALNPGTGDQYKTGWTNSIQYFKSRGFKAAELYATTWGPANSNYATDQTHSCEYLTFLRKFVDAVLDYSGSDKISIVAHSMGVTLARKVIKGGSHTDRDGTSCDLGPPLTGSVDTFIGIAGGNRGLTNCWGAGKFMAPTCNDVTGFYPGSCYNWNGCRGNAPGFSKYLALLNSKPDKFEGQNVFSIWSKGDELIGYGDIVWGYPTSAIPGQDDEKVYITLKHMECKDQTVEEQYGMIINHAV